MKIIFTCLLLVAATQAVRLSDLKHVTRTVSSPRLVEPIENNGERIIGGDFATVGQFPYQIGMRMDDAYFCGGSLITDSIVLTAAHCVEGFSKWEVHLGALNFTDTTESGRVIVVSNNGQPHEDYSALTIQNDIALVHLPEPVSGPNIDFIRLPSWSMENELFEYEDVTVSGWGKPTDESTGISEILKFVQLDVINNTQCDSWYPGVIQPSNICTHSHMGTEATCSGDSGGPLVYYESDGLPTEVGIVSFGIAFGCETRWPSAYTRVTSYLAWLEANAGVTLRP